MTLRRLKLIEVRLSDNGERTREDPSETTDKFEETLLDEITRLQKTTALCAIDRTQKKIFTKNQSTMKGGSDYENKLVQKLEKLQEKLAVAEETEK
jgi:flagellar hook-basal body complex protein FliE